MAERRHTQARGRARRQALITATEAVLERYSLHEISLTMIAEEAGIPASSAYHFYPDLNELFKDVARSIALGMIEKIGSAQAAPAGHWETIVRRFLERACSIFNTDAAARELMLGSRTPPDIKRAGCFEDSRFGHALLELVAREFLLPPIKDAEAVFFRGIQICDLMFSLSVAEEGRVTPGWCEEGCVASIAYLGLYLPQRLERRDEAPVLTSIDATERPAKRSSSKQITPK